MQVVEVVFKVKIIASKAQAFLLGKGQLESMGVWEDYYTNLYFSKVFLYFYFSRFFYLYLDLLGSI